MEHCQTSSSSWPAGMCWLAVSWFMVSGGWLIGYRERTVTGYWLLVKICETRKKDIREKREKLISC
jgi:hypothetical protein